MIKLLQGDALAELKKLPSESVDCCISSPPYWGLRDYKTEPQIWDAKEGCEHKWKEHRTPPKGGHTKPDNMPNVGANRAEQDGEMSIRFGYTSNFCSLCGAWRGSLGLEPDFTLYIKHLCDIYDEVKRVLKKTGSCWIVIGDTYSGSGNGSGDKTSKIRQGIKRENFDKIYQGQKSGKTNLQDKSLCQIPSRFSIEMVNRGWILRNEIIWFKRNCMPSSVKDRFTVDFEKVFFFVKSKRYWFEQQFEPHLSKEPNPEYTRPADSKSRSATLQPRSETAFVGPYNPQGRNMRCVWDIPTMPFKGAHFAVFPEKLVEPMIKAGCPVNGVVLDPFSGASTTLVVAKKLGRQGIGIELNPEYIKMSEERLKKITPPLF